MTGDLDKRLTVQAVEKLQQALEYITDHPSEWDQNTWGEKTPCGTVACLAGWLVLLDPVWSKRVRYDLDPIEGLDDRRPVHLMSVNSGAVADAALEVLGVPYPSELASSLDWVFLDTMIGIRDLWLLVQLVAEGRLKIPEQFVD